MVDLSDLAAPVGLVTPGTVLGLVVGGWGLLGLLELGQARGND